MAYLKGKFISAKQDWETPIELFNKLNERFHFTIDLAADDSNKKCEKYFSKEDDALNQSWSGICWLNPPYGEDREHQLSKWVAKSYEESRKPDCTVVMLIPARTNTNWFHQYAMKSKEILLICGRPKFVGAVHGLPQPLAIIVFENTNEPVKLSSFYLN